MDKRKDKSQKRNTQKSDINLDDGKEVQKTNNKTEEKDSFLLQQLNQKIDDINKLMMKNNLLDLAELLGNRKQLLFRNLWSGMAKGIGIGIGVTVITAILVILLQKIVTLNIPVIGEYIADIVDIVQKSR